MIPELQPVQKSRWGLKLANHLLHRAGFGFPYDRARKLAGTSPEEAVSELVHFLDDDPAPAEPPEEDMPRDITRQQLQRMISDLPYKEKQDRRQKFRREQRGAVRNVIRPWWIRRMLETSNPLREKLTLFWHGHFATSARKVRTARYNLHINQVFRDNAAGNFRELTRAVGKAPAMLRYLDNYRSKKQHPNENWARELLELFTMGLGNYTEKDMKEAARAFTGWTIKDGAFTFRKSWHDKGKKKFLGEKGNFDGDDIINIIFEQPEPSRFIVRKLWEYFVYPSPDKKIVRELAALLRLSNYELRPVLKRMFLSKEFYSERAMGTLVKNPVEFVVGLHGELKHSSDGSSADPRRMDNQIKKFGQKLFFPPNVSGWKGNRAWIDTNKLLNRYNTLSSFIQKGSADKQLKNRLKSVDGKPLKHAIAKLEKTLLPMSLDTSQRKALARKLAGTKNLKKSFKLKDTSKKKLHAFGQLLLSTAEYQLS